MSGLEIFESIAEAGGRILRVEADQVGAAPGVLALTFDIGRVLIRSGDEGLEITQTVDREGLPEGLIALDEDEPWWRLLGQKVSAAWSGGVEEGVGARGLHSLMVLKLRFRESAENPRTLCLETIGRSVRISLEMT